MFAPASPTAFSCWSRICAVLSLAEHHICSIEWGENVGQIEAVIYPTSVNSSFNRLTRFNEGLGKHPVVQPNSQPFIWK
jgi:hypothetical protein